MRELALHVLDIAENSVKANATLVTVEIEAVDNVLTIRISDDGKGMSEDFLKRVTDNKADRYRSTEASQGTVVRRRVKNRRVRCSDDVLAWGCIGIPFVF